MIFNSFQFIFLFFPISFLIYRYTIKKNYNLAIISLVVSSLIFYGWWNPRYLILIITSILCNYCIAKTIQNKKLMPRKRKYLLILGVSLNLFVLGFYKYVDFIISNLNHIPTINLKEANIVLPLAISFFTFQQITYLVDSYKEEIENHNFLYYCLYVTFFPQLIAGPIVHHKEVLPQFINKQPQHLTSDDVAKGLMLFVIGLSKKVILADTLAQIANPVFNTSELGEAISFLDAWKGALAYSLQLYFDFSGYSDMAIGIALFFGIVLPVNFNSPYKAKSIIEFWRRWHITLSRFLRDYLYIPLGGNRKGALYRYRNLFITMVLGGLWHGAGWNFVIWGSIHAGYLCVNHFWNNIMKDENTQKSPTKITVYISQFTTFIFVVFAWIFFRAKTFSSAIIILKSMCTVSNTYPTNLLFHNTLWEYITIGFSFLIVFGSPNAYEIIRCPKLHYSGAKPPIKYKWRHIVTTALFFIISLLLVLTIQKPEFLYYDF